MRGIQVWWQQPGVKVHPELLLSWNDIKNIPFHIYIDMFYDFKQKRGEDKYFN